MKINVKSNILSKNYETLRTTVDDEFFNTNLKVSTTNHQLYFVDIINIFQTSSIINNIKNNQTIQIEINDMGSGDYLTYIKKHFLHKFFNAKKPTLAQPAIAQTSASLNTANIKFNIFYNRTFGLNHDFYKYSKNIGFDEALSIAVLHELGHVLHQTNNHEISQKFFNFYFKNPNNELYKNFSESYADLYSIFALSIIAPKIDIISKLDNLISLREDFSKNQNSIQFDTFYILKKIKDNNLISKQPVNNFEKLNNLIINLAIENVKNTISELKNGYKTDFLDLSFQFENEILILFDNNKEQSNKNIFKK